MINFKTATSFFALACIITSTEAFSWEGDEENPNRIITASKSANPIEVFVAEDLSPSDDDPWQKNRVIKTLPKDFQTYLYNRNKESFLNEEDFETSLNMLKQREDRNLVCNLSHKISQGEEEEGTVYLGQEIPTGQYVAIKRGSDKSEVEIQNLSGIFVTLPKAFQKDLYNRNKESFTDIEDFKASLNKLKQREDRKLVQMGQFIYNPFHQIAQDGKGTVYLAQHVPTGQYVQVKRSYNKSEYLAFQNLNRLFACYKSDENPDPYYYIFTPLIISGTIEDCYNSICEKDVTTFKNIGLVVKEKTRNDKTIKTLSYDDLNHNLVLMEAVIREEEYLIRMGAEYNPIKSDDKFVIGDAGSKSEVIFGNLKPAKKGAQRSENHLLFLFCDLLGLKRFLQGDGSLRKDTIAPEVLNIFIKEYSEYRMNRSYTLEMAKDLLKRLKKGITSNT